jgi:hypothetical protein
MQKKKKVRPHFTLLTKINSKCIEDLNVRAKKNHRDEFSLSSIWELILKYITKSTSNKRKRKKQR